MTINHFCICALSIALAAGGTFAQENAAPPAAATIDPGLDKDNDAFMNRQAQALLEEVSTTLAHVPPQLPEPRERRLALLLLDGVLHDVYAPARPAVQDYFHARMQSAIEDIEKTKVEQGARVWKLYNHGFVVRTASVTLAFDLNPGTEGFRLKDPQGKTSAVPTPGFPIDLELRERLAKQCDVLFISHRHGDHANESMATLFLEQGKPVVAPDDVFEGKPLQQQITHLKREVNTMQELAVKGGAVTLKLVVYPGQQYQGSGIPNNVVLVFTPEGLSFAHNGDQINDPYPQYQEDFKWSDQVREHYQVDVLMTNCWMNDIFRFVRGFNPKLVLPGHENEMGHPMWDRVPYWGDSEYLQLNYPELKASEYPVLVMTWGESYEIVK